jgi:SM-20-related protein
VRRSAATPSPVELRGVSLVDESIRKTSHSLVSESTVSYIENRLLAIWPDLEQHFNVKLTAYEQPYFARYGVGAFFRPHADSGATAESPERVRARKVTVVIFLNGASEEVGPDSYGGGALTFYGLIDDPVWKPMGFPLIGETGLLIAFRAETIHEVAPITHGERYTILSRFS